ncbi:GNAT family N-acetyltransferase [Pseudophaeobacter sp.]|uniref:GNAT family N-acetyltransferase n=1 Tax=Pseudophaeobacter sp. TaxID=1971739 RepID=UPI003A97373E
MTIPPPAPTAPILRAAQPTDAGRLGAILFQAQQRARWLPKLYAEVEMIAFCGVMIDRGWVTVAVQNGVIQGFVARDGAEICSLYLAAGACGQGLGAALMDAAKDTAPMLWLRVIAANEAARRFYLRQGFREAGRSDGSDTAEALPLIRFEWHDFCQKETAA